MTATAAAIEHRWKMMADHRYRRADATDGRADGAGRKKGRGGTATATLILLNVSAERVVIREGGHTTGRTTWRHGHQKDGRTNQPLARLRSCLSDFDRRTEGRPDREADDERASGRVGRSAATTTTERWLPMPIWSGRVETENLQSYSDRSKCCRH